MGQIESGYTDRFPEAYYDPKAFNALTEEEKVHIAERLEQAKKDYAVVRLNGMPSHVEKAPMNDALEQNHVLDILQMTGSTVDQDVKNIFGSVNWLFDTPARHFQDFEKSVRIKPLPLWETPKHWQEDKFFANMRLYGPNPFMIEGIDEIPQGFDITRVEEYLKKKNLPCIADALKSGDMFKTDYTIMKNVNHATYKLACPICLFMQIEDQLTPIAIKLNYYDGEMENPVFIPSDPSWFRAKIWVQNADMQIHESNKHLLETHLIIEAAALAVHRWLDVTHPVFQILKPHFFWTMIINQAARGKLINKGGVFDQIFSIGSKGLEELCKAGWCDFNLQDVSIPTQISKRKLKNLKKFYWATDALKLWNTIHDYVKEFLGVFYKNDQDILDDTYLKDFLLHLGDECNFKGILQQPTCLQLVEMITNIIWCGTGGHSAVNFPQYRYFAYVPFYPALLRDHPPKDIHEDKKYKQEDPNSVSSELEEYLCKHSYPKTKEALQQITISRLLSTPTDVSIGAKLPLHFKFRNVEVQNSVYHFRKALIGMSHSIYMEQRENNNEHLYLYLVSDHVCQSVSI